MVKNLNRHLLGHQTDTEGLLKSVHQRGCNQTYTSCVSLKRHSLLVHKQGNEKGVDLMLACDAPDQSNENLENAVDVEEKVPDCDYPNVKDEIEEVVFD
jgi:hypothetical protein